MSTPVLASGEQPVPAGNGHGGHSPAFPPRLLTDLLDRALRVYGDRTAIDFLGRRWTYSELGALVERAARGLQDIGVKPGDRVGLCLPNTHYYIVLYFATLRVGGIVVNLNPLYVERELCHLLKDSGTSVLVTCDLPPIYTKVAKVAADVGVRRLVTCSISDALPTLKSLAYKLFKRKDVARIPHDALNLDFATLIASRAPRTPVPLQPDDVAVLQYTGGTTGEPKAAMLTHANLAVSSAQMIAHIGRMPSGQERTMGVLPLFHVFALTTVLNYSIDTGAEMVLLPRFDLKQMIDTIQRTRCTQLFAVPTIYGAMNGLPDKDLAKLKSLRFSISGGAPLPFDVRQRFEARTGARVVEGYGLSEASPIITCNPVEGEIKANSAGVRFPGTVIEIRDIDDPHKILPVGERGEICARGPQVMKGYWNRPEATAEVFIDGALRTGDVGYLDEDGYLFIVDRMKDMILCGGYNVYPRTIEEALYEHPAVAEAVVIGVPDKYRGQAPKAFVTLFPDHTATPDELRHFLDDKLSKIEMPREVEIRAELPKTLIGKLSKKELIAEELAKANG